MTDVVSAVKRSQMMAGIGGKDTKPELVIRKALHSKGFRYRLHDLRLPGKPDLVFPRYNSVVFINGCFWHGHTCHLFKWPTTRRAFWRDKITGTVERDRRNRLLLESKGWRILTVWECSLKGKTRLKLSDVIATISTWIVSGNGNMEIQGQSNVID